MTSSEEVPESARRFITDYIDSVEQLRVLLLLFSNPERKWTVPEITQELRSAEGSIAKRLNDLYDRQILVRGSAGPAHHHFAPQSPEIRAAVGELSEQFERRPYRVMDLIYSKPNEALRDFADAFKIGKDGKR